MLIQLPLSPCDLCFPVTLISNAAFLIKATRNGWDSEQKNLRVASNYLQFIASSLFLSTFSTTVAHQYSEPISVEVKPTFPKYFPDFYFNFGPGGELELNSAQHNARTVAHVCRVHPQLHSFLCLIPGAFSGINSTLDNSMHTVPDSHYVDMLGFCSQGLARLPAHRRLQNAAIAAELFFWLTSEAPDRQIPPICQTYSFNYHGGSEFSDSALDSLSHNTQEQQVCLISPPTNRTLELSRPTQMCVKTEQPSLLGCNQPILPGTSGSDRSHSSVDGKGTYRLDGTATPGEINSTSSVSVQAITCTQRKNNQECLTEVLNDGGLIESIEGGVYIRDLKAARSMVQDDHIVSVNNAQQTVAR
ncbi:hypothetical protein P879_02888 [Paragonimus westermani]|uniref:Uncharacterized protein n=1 Tax=Paragonimus westermani TaxID=34504 RepID=A0A8T0DVP9_9TREM|nr:hypothetical protein P879_02888 [Paragonimus westermani]